MKLRLCHYLQESLVKKNDQLYNGISLLIDLYKLLTILKVKLNTYVVALCTFGPQITYTPIYTLFSHDRQLQHMVLSVTFVNLLGDITLIIMNDYVLFIYVLYRNSKKKAINNNNNSMPVKKSKSLFITISFVLN